MAWDHSEDLSFVLCMLLFFCNFFILQQEDRCSVSKMKGLFSFPKSVAIGKTQVPYVVPYSFADLDDRIGFQCI